MIVRPFSEPRDLEAALPQVRACLGDSGVVLLPTETFYGLACDPWSKTGVRRVFELKNRPRESFLPVLAANWEQVDRLVLVAETWRARLRALWPGAITVVLPTRKTILASSGSTVAVRIPGHGLLRQLLEVTGPLTGTSANSHGETPENDLEGALRSLGGDPDLALDGGPTPGGSPSTLVDLTGPEAQILRQGLEVWD
jgi:L-threonylcarbamoyladenylate synthase